MILRTLHHNLARILVGAAGVVAALVAYFAAGVPLL